MKKENINSLCVEDIFFTQGGLNLSLKEIINGYRVISITISYLSVRRKVRKSGFLGLFGVKDSIQDEKIMTIKDEGGIIFYNNNGHDGRVTIHFDNLGSFEQLDFKAVDSQSLWGRVAMNIDRPYLLNFPAKNIISMSWVEK